MSNSKVCVIEDFYAHNMRRRYGGIVPVHEGIDTALSRNLDQYDERLDEFLSYIDQLLEIPLVRSEDSPSDPAWMNGFFPAFDALTLFCLISSVKPKIYLEIGSGNSTAFAARAKRLNSPSTIIVSIDPFPRREIDALCDEVIRRPLEACDMSTFDRLSEGDLLLFDGSHRVLQNSDASVFFLDVMPRLKKDVYVHFHDIFWPYDYPDQWSNRMYSEQYVLGALILFAYDQFEIILPNTYISWRTHLLDRFDVLWNAPHLKGIDRHGSSFWTRKKEQLVTIP